MSHAPKTLALEALLDGVLSDRGRERIERHLSHCAICRGELRLMQRYRGTLRAVHDTPLPEIDWARFEDELGAPAPAPPTTPHAAPDRRRLWVWPMVAVAAATFVLWFSPSGQAPEPPTSEKPIALPQAVPPPPERPPIEGRVTFAANEAVIEDADGAREEVEGDERVREGSVLRTGPHGMVHVRLWQGTGLALSPSSELVVEGLRRAQADLRLRRGHVQSQVAPLQNEDRYAVRVDDYGAHVVGTRFGVGREDGVARVRVQEGVVELRKGDTRIELLRAGDHWSSERRAGLAEERQGSEALPLHGLDEESGEWPLLTLPPLPRVTAWQPFDEPIRAAGTLRMRAPPGPGSLNVLDDQGRLHAIEFELGPEGLALTERTVWGRRERSGPRWGTLAKEKIRPVVRGGLPDLRRCYDQTLRHDQSASGVITLELRVSRVGRVADARVDAPELPSKLGRCIKKQVKRWVFPEPEGGPVQLALPVSLRPGRR